MSVLINWKPVVDAIDRNTATVREQSQQQLSTAAALAQAIRALTDPPKGRFIITVEER